MKNFSEIKLDNSPKNQLVLDYARSISGLPEDACKNLYESFKYSVGDSEFTDEDAMKMFNEYFKVEKPIDINIFGKEIVDDLKKMGDMDESSLTRRSFSNHLMSLLKRYLFKNDTPSMLEVLACILKLKDSENGGKLMQSLNIGKKAYKKLNEDCVDLSKIRELDISGTPYSAEDTKDDYEFYDELKYLLSERFKDYSSQSNNIKNIYDTIMDYVNSRCNQLQSESIIKSTDESRYYDFIKDILTTPQMNGMYMNVDYLKSITSDLQTLLFDLIIIINTHVQKSLQNYGDYIDPEKIYEYNNSLKTLASRISSSSNSSLLYETDDLKSKISDKISSRIAIDCVQIISAIRGEFNINIRRCMTLFVSKSFELIHSLKDIDIKLYNNTVIFKNK